MDKPTAIRRSFAEALRSAWRSTARPEQLPPDGDWLIWLLMAGRGFGKTRTGSEATHEAVAAGAQWIHLIAPTAADCRDVLVEGPAGLIATAPAHSRPIYQPSLRKVVWPNGAQALLFSADEPDRLRGPQCEFLWIDELAAMRHAQEILDMALMGLRLGKHPRCVITTTPRPLKCIKALLAREGQDVAVTRGSTYDNRANLASNFFQQVISKYENTRLGRQEIYAEVLTDTPGALWHLERIEELRVARGPQPCQRVVVAVDPATTFGPDSDETGIIVAALGQDGHGFILDDLSGRYPPEEWARRAIGAYRQYCADRIIAEVNQGGAMVEATLRSVDPAIPFGSVHASRGKMTRAEPVSALYERGLVHHVGQFGPLEDQLTSYDGIRTGGSPDRLDSLVWALTELMLGEPPGGYIKESALLPRPAADGAVPAPIDTPENLLCVFASAAVGIGPDPGALAVVFCGLSVSPLLQHQLLTILDWDLRELSPDTIGKWFGGVQKRLNQLGQCSAFGHDGLVIDPGGFGGTLYEQGMGRYEVTLLDNQKVMTMTLAERALAASGHVQSGRVQITRPAYEQITAYNGVTKNHFLSQVAEFSVGTPPTEIGPLLAAFSNSVLTELHHPRKRALASIHNS